MIVEYHIKQRIFGSVTFVQRFTVLCCLAALAFACTDSSSINTPKEIDWDNVEREFEVPLLAVEVTMLHNGEPQEMFIVQNRFSCKVNTAAQPPQVSINIEMQNTRLEPVGQTMINSVYFRCQDVPASDSYISLAGDPDDNRLTSASKVLLINTDRELVEYIPGKDTLTENDFEIRFQHNESLGEILGHFTFFGVVEIHPGIFEEENISGTLTIRYRR